MKELNLNSFLIILRMGVMEGFWTGEGHGQLCRTSQVPLHRFFFYLIYSFHFLLFKLLPDFTSYRRPSLTPPKGVRHLFWVPTAPGDSSIPAPTTLAYEVFLSTNLTMSLSYIDSSMAPQCLPASEILRLTFKALPPHPPTQTGSVAPKHRARPCGPQLMGGKLGPVLG